MLEKQMQRVALGDRLSIRSAKQLPYIASCSWWLHSDSLMWIAILNSVSDFGSCGISRLQAGNVALQMFTTVPSRQWY